MRRWMLPAIVGPALAMGAFAAHAQGAWGTYVVKELGIVFSAILMSMFYIGGELAQSRLGLPKSLTGVFQGLLLFTLLACDTLIAYRVRWRAAGKGATA